MRQLTEKEALDFAKSGIWKNWSDELIAGFQLHQKKLCMDFSRFHEAVEKTLGRPVYTHEFGIKEAFENIKAEFLCKRAMPTIDEIINYIPKEKRVLVIGG